MRQGGAEKIVWRTTPTKWTLQGHTQCRSCFASELHPGAAHHKLLTDKLAQRGRLLPHLSAHPQHLRLCRKTSCLLALLTRRLAGACGRRFTLAGSRAAAGSRCTGRNSRSLRPRQRLQIDRGQGMEGGPCDRAAAGRQAGAERRGTRRSVQSGSTRAPTCNKVTAGGHERAPRLLRSPWAPSCCSAVSTSTPDG